MNQGALAAFRSLAELDACVALQIAVWAYANEDVLPRPTFVLANHIGEQVFGLLVKGS